MDELVIREVKPEDIEAACDIAVAAWEPIFVSFRRMMGDELFALACRDWQQRKAQQVREACQGVQGAMAAVAELDGRVVGFVTFYAHDASRIGEISNNAVHPRFQGRGIAPTMYEHVCARLRELGMLYVKVSTGGDPGHAPARRAYEKAGFSIRLPGIEYYRKL
jgi:ribosomal protein S18 acetylase RimI-like enzyme